RSQHEQEDGGQEQVGAQYRHGPLVTESWLRPPRPAGRGRMGSEGGGIAWLTRITRSAGAMPTKKSDGRGLPGLRAGVVCRLVRGELRWQEHSPGGLTPGRSPGNACRIPGARRGRKRGRAREERLTPARGP